MIYEMIFLRVCVRLWACTSALNSMIWLWLLLVAIAAGSYAAKRARGLSRGAGFADISMWWLYVLPHAWCADRLADAGLGCMLLPRWVCCRISQHRFLVAVCAAAGTLSLCALRTVEFLAARRACVCEPMAFQLCCSWNTVDPIFDEFLSALWLFGTGGAFLCVALARLVWLNFGMFCGLLLFLYMTSRAGR